MKPLKFETWSKNEDGGAGWAFPKHFEGPVFKIFRLPKAYVTGLHRDGVGYRNDEVTRWVVRAKWAVLTEDALMNIGEHLEAQYEEVEKLWKRYEDKLEAFRSAVKNDMMSIDATAKRSDAAVNRMSIGYHRIIEQLNSPEMERAVANAERLATALEALQRVKPHTATLTVTDMNGAA